MNLHIDNTYATWGPYRFARSIGRNGFSANKVEGDGTTPIGHFTFRKIYYRADRVQCPQTVLPVSELTPECGWCDDPQSPDYNRYIQKPYRMSHESMWMDKSLYDIVIVVGHNDDPAVAGKGSAVFIHIAPENWGPTSGCIGLQKKDLITVVEQATTQTQLIINGEEK